MPKLARERTLSSTHSLALLSSQLPERTETVQYSHRCMPSTRRLVQLRRGVLLVFRKRVHQLPVTSSPDDDLPHAERAIVLTRDLPITRVGDLALQLGKKERFWFASPFQRDHWLSLIQSAQYSNKHGAHRYRIHAQLSNDAAATVYLVSDILDGNHYALKVVTKTDTLFVKSNLDSLVSERLALERAVTLDSAFIVRLVDAFQTQSSLCLVTELAKYGDLARLQRSLPSKRMPESVARALFAEIVLALEDIHRLGFLYRDMKLENVLLNGSGHVRIGNFGLAKRMAVEFEDSSTSSVSGSYDESSEEDEPFRLLGRTSTFVGTRRYMSPEHLTVGDNDKKGYGAPADIWALGVTLYILLTGREPFARNIHARNSSALFNAIRNEQVVYPEFLSEEAVSLLSGMLERNVDKRFDFGAIKAHVWLADMDWRRIGHDSYNNVPQREMLSLLQQAGIESVDSALASVTKNVDCEMFSSMLGRTMVWEKPKPATKSRKSYELIGFEFLKRGNVERESSRWNSMVSSF